MTISKPADFLRTQDFSAVPEVFNIIYRTHVSREPNGLNIVVQIQTRFRLWSLPHYNNSMYYLHVEKPRC